jgi:hypothetical protein
MLLVIQLQASSCSSAASVLRKANIAEKLVTQTYQRKLVPYQQNLSRPFTCLPRIIVTVASTIHATQS